jgi:hypothetical protein
LFDEYTHKVKGRFFHILWYLHYGCDEAPKEDVICKRAKRYVYRFFMFMEKVDTAVIWVYPACFQFWTKGVQNNKEIWTWVKDSMYPCKGKNEPQQMNDWEVLHCPWYLELDGWKQCFDDNERTQFRRITAREQPETLFSSVKEGNEGEAAQSIFQVDAIAEVQPFYADKSRKGRAKKKAESTPKPATSKRKNFLTLLRLFSAVA